MNADAENKSLIGPRWAHFLATATVVRFFDDGALLVAPDTGTLLSLNRSGASIYDALARGCSATEISTALSERFGIAREQAERDIRVFLGSEPIGKAEFNPAAIETSRFRFARCDIGYVVTRDGRVCLDVDVNGRTLSIAPTIPFPEAREAALWVTTKLAILQGRPILHASAIRTEGGASIAFAGYSGAGKTSLGHAFAQAGAHLLGEDSFELRIPPERGSVALIPFEDRARRWADDLVRHARPGRPYPATLPATPDDGSAVKLDGIFIVDRERRSGDAFSVRPLGLTAAAAAVTVNLFWASINRSACEQGLDWADRVARRVQVAELTAPNGVSALTPAARDFLQDIWPRQKTASY